jgi:bifunctional DNA-binding transcriptional regulator/antitoxin component of YhaV-PrlF toxin-antitoxin module
VRLRPKNQVTIPDAIVQAAGASVGDEFLVTVQGGTIRLDRVLHSYRGVLKGVWGPNWLEELRAERDQWTEERAYPKK